MKSDIEDAAVKPTAASLSALIWDLHNTFTRLSMAMEQSDIGFCIALGEKAILEEENERLTQNMRSNEEMNQIRDYIRSCI